MSYLTVVLTRRLHPGLVYNMDETWLTVGERDRLTVVVPREATRARVPSPEKFPWHMTLVATIRADGAALKPVIILPHVFLPRQLEQFDASFHFSGTQKGWITMAVFEEWVEKVLVVDVKQQREKLALRGEVALDAPALLVVDAHRSRESQRAAEAMRAENIHCAILPAHSTTVMQPLDRVIFGKFKAGMRKYFKVQQVKYEDKRTALVGASVHAFYDAVYADHVREAFGACGISPWDPHRALRDPALVTSHEEGPATGNDMRKRGVRIAGCVLTSNEMQHLLAERSARQPKIPRHQRRDTAPTAELETPTAVARDAHSTAVPETPSAIPSTQTTLCSQDDAEDVIPPPPPRDLIVSCTPPSAKAKELLPSSE